MNGRFAIVAGANRHALADRLEGVGLDRWSIAEAEIFADAGMVAAVDPRGAGLVLGKLFDRADYRAITDLGAGHFHAVADSGGRHLIDRFWGAYIAVAGKGSRFGTFVVRDPSAQFPLYRWSLDGCALYFNDFGLALSIAGEMPTFDWPAIAHRLRFPALRIAETGLKEICEIIPGSRVCLETDDVAQIWSPWDYATAGKPAPSFAVFEYTVQQSVRAWAECFARLDVELSGGLDSSIVAACISSSRQHWRAITYATDAPEGDERRYARAVAEACGVSLEEFVVTADGLDPTALPVTPRVRPGGFTVLSTIDRMLGEASRAANAEAIFSGGGGDNVFCKIRSAGPVVDAFLSDGIRQSLRTARDLAELCETSLWDSIRHAVRQWRKRRSAHWPASDGLLGQWAMVACRGHPWFERAQNLPGKRAHVANLVGVLPFLDGYDRSQAFPMIYPLLAQPVVELCLAVPSWRWITGGRDRAFARDAFAGRLPASVIQRRTKGGLRSVMIPAFERNRTVLSSLLCEGRLAEQGLIDRAAVEAVMKTPVSPTRTDYVRVFELADVELWIRSIDDLVSRHPR